MEAMFDGSLGTPTFILPAGALLLALSFECVDGLRNAANMVATGIFTFPITLPAGPV